jgi:nicotinate-nucleotide adenylyltransferase
VKRLGIFGGTFDPVHVGHLAAASAARYELHLDEVLLVVAGDPWQKHGAVVAPAAARLEMVEAAIDGIDGLVASRIELDRPGLTYTADTVAALRAPGHELFLIVGADVAERINTWHRVEEFREDVTLAFVAREGNAPPAAPAGWRAVQVTMPRLDVSSTDLRRRVATGAPIEFLMPQSAVRVLRAHGLYTAR